MKKILGFFFTQKKKLCNMCEKLCNAFSTFFILVIFYEKKIEKT